MTQSAMTSLRLDIGDLFGSDIVVAEIADTKLSDYWVH